MPVKKTRRPRVSQQVSLDAKQPIPFELGGQAFSFVNQVSYLPFLPPKDEFAQMLLEARLLSVTNNACIDTKKDYCAGEGFMDNEGREFTTEIIDWFKSMNLKNQSATEINQNIFEDYFTFGNVPIEVVRFEVAGVRKLFVYPHSFLEWRLCKPNDDDVVTEAVQSKLFLRNLHGYITLDMLKKSKRLPLYNPLLPDKGNWFKDEKGVERTLLWYKDYYTGFHHYGLASNVSCMVYELLEYKGARYNLDNFDNNLVVASILALKGNLSPEEANRIAKQIITQHTGDGKRGRTVVIASEEGIEGSDIHKLDTKTDGSFNESDRVWTEKIIQANEWDAILAGIISPSTLGKGAGFLTKIIEHKLKTVIRPAQRDIINKIWSKIFTIAEDWLQLPFSKYNVVIKNEIDISGLTDVDITEAVQINEVRTAKGLQEDPKMAGVYMKAAKPAIEVKEEKEDDDV